LSIFGEEHIKIGLFRLHKQAGPATVDLAKTRYYFLPLYSTLPGSTEKIGKKIPI
jgi:hypothetical protein